MWPYMTHVSNYKTCTKGQTHNNLKQKYPQDKETLTQQGQWHAINTCEKFTRRLTIQTLAGQAYQPKNVSSCYKKMDIEPLDNDMQNHKPQENDHWIW